jgi:hypothetical protein
LPTAASPAPPPLGSQRAAPAPHPNSHGGRLHAPHPPADAQPRRITDLVVESRRLRALKRPMSQPSATGRFSSREPDSGSGRPLAPRTRRKSVDGCQLPAVARASPEFAKRGWSSARSYPAHAQRLRRSQIQFVSGAIRAHRHQSLRPAALNPGWTRVRDAFAATP